MSWDMARVWEPVSTINLHQLAADVGVELLVEWTQLLQQGLKVSLECVRLVE